MLMIVALVGTGTWWDWHEYPRWVGRGARAAPVISEQEKMAEEAVARARQYDGELVDIPGGSYHMGGWGWGNDNERPTHSVTVSAFRMGKHEVTVGQFRRFVETTGYRTDAERNAGCRIFSEGTSDWIPGSSWRNPGYSVEDNHPVVCVSWNEVQAFVRWLAARSCKAFRLPTEAEWEYAVRAGSTTKYHFGNIDSQLCQYGNHADTSTDFGWRNRSCSDGVGDRTAEVGQYKPNGNGLHDMHGNVWEWVQDCYNDSYMVDLSRQDRPRGTSSLGGWVQECYDNSCQGAPQDGSAWLQGYCDWRVTRSGSWASQPRDLRSSLRSWNTRSHSFNALGFRVVQDKQAGD